MQKLIRIRRREFSLIVAALSLIASAPHSWSRTWTDSTGRTIEAEIVRADEKSVVIDKAGKEFTHALDKLTEADRDYVKEWLEKQETAEGSGSTGASADGNSFDGKPLVKGGKVNVFHYPYDAETLDLVSRKFKGKDTGFRIGIAVPADFDPSKPQKVFVVHAPGNNDQQRSSGNTGAMGTYAKHCVDAGWVCLAYDSNLGRVPHTADQSSCFRVLCKVWPDINDWQFAVGGFSGGAKASFGTCGFLLRCECEVLGVFLAGCNKDTSEWGKKQHRAPSKGYRKLKVFLSTGDADSYVNEGQLKEVISSLRSNGMRNLRSERFKGGHVIHQPHIAEALKWFGSPGE